MEVYSAGTLKVSKRIWAAVSRFARGLRGGSVRRTGCCYYKDSQSAKLWWPFVVWVTEEILCAAIPLHSKSSALPDTQIAKSSPYHPNL